MLVLIRAAAVTVATAAVMLLSTLPAAAQPSPSPPLPTLPDDLLPKGDVERFKVTIAGSQQASLNFAFDAAPGVDCSLEGGGTLTESWQYRRGKGVVVAFRKLGPGVVLLQRTGRAPGDTALAAPGTVTRDATGSVQTRTPLTCNSFALHVPACGQQFPVRSDLNLGWSKGKLTLVPSSNSAQKLNPALACGMNEVWNFDVFSFRYANLNAQSGALPLRKVFKSKRNLKVELKDHFLQPADSPAGYTTLVEKLGGRSTVTLKRLKK